MFSVLGLDKVAAQAIGVVILVVLLIGGYYYWRHAVKAEALLEWNKAQQEVVAKEQQKLIEDLTEINKTQKQIVSEIHQRNELLEKKFNELEDYLNRPDTAKQYHGKQSSDVLKRTFKELNK